ncbi:hypothetical protein ABKN59_008792 [Abortiporus biennis]
MSFRKELVAVSMFGHICLSNVIHTTATRESQASPFSRHGMTLIDNVLFGKQAVCCSIIEFRHLETTSDISILKIFFDIFILTPGFRREICGTMNMPSHSYRKVEVTLELDPKYYHGSCMVGRIGFIQIQATADGISILDYEQVLLIDPSYPSSYFTTIELSSEIPVIATPFATNKKYRPHVYPPSEFICLAVV